MKLFNFTSAMVILFFNFSFAGNGYWNDTSEYHPPVAADPVILSGNMNETDSFIIIDNDTINIAEDLKNDKDNLHNNGIVNFNHNSGNQTNVINNSAYCRFKEMTKKMYIGRFL